MRFWHAIKDYVFIILIVVLIRTYIVTPAIVDGGSMDTTLADGQVVFINKIAYKFDDVERFDIVVLKEKDTNEKIIKRIIGLPNETIEYKSNILYINGNAIAPVGIEFKETEDFTAKTGENEYFVLGDNRPLSKDSRMLGNFKQEDFVGRVTFRLWPLNKLGTIN